jgi:uncharacterized protein (TIGR02246 family)
MNSEEAQIRERLDQWARALRAKDLDRLMAFYAPEVITFDMVPPLQVSGADNYRKHWSQWFESMSGPITHETRELVVAVGGDVAYAHQLSLVGGAQKGGNSSESWIRTTTGLRKMGGQWLITHEHVSVPFDMESGKADMELTP